MEILYKSHSFPRRLGPSLRGTNSLNFTASELMWAAITVGRANFTDVISNGIYSEYEALYRASIIVANLALDADRVVKSSAYVNLDPSEKGAVSYFLGLSFTKLLSSRLLQAPWLLHIDVYRQQFQARGQAFGFGSSKTRPDLIGLDTAGNWIVLESKGRTNEMEDTLLASAKNQTRNLRRIGRTPPRLRVAVVTHFIKGKLSVDWADPEEHNNIYFDIETSETEYLLNYYRLIYNVLSTNNNLLEVGDFLTFTFEAVNLTLGLRKDIYSGYSTGQLTVQQILRTPQTPESKRQTLFVAESYEDSFIGADGIIVGLGNNWLERISSNRRFNE